MRGKGGRRRRVVVVGLDGTPHDLVVRLTDAGVMPRYAALRREGSLRRMETTIPDVSSVAWASLVTGRNPGKHGIFGFVDLRGVEEGAASPYETFYPNLRHLRGNSLWDLVGLAGKRSIFLNVPGTYPARALRGVMVSGFVAIDLARATYPPTALPTLRRLGYRIDVDARKAIESHDLLLEDLRETLDARRKTALHFLRAEDFDLAFLVDTGTDRLHHFLWDAGEDERHARHGAFLDYYRAVDGFLGDLMDEIGSGAELGIVSDHGFTGIEREFYVNRWLEAEGDLSLAPAAVIEPGAELSALAPATRAFALDPCRIFVHARGRFPNGSIEPEDVERVRAELAARLLAIEAPNGRGRVFRAVHRGCDLYRGPFAARAADLVAVPHDGFDPKATFSEHGTFGRRHFTGMHTQHGAHVYWRGRELRPGVANVLDVAPTVLELLGVPRPDDLDGRSLLA